jgi:hypothetical protein
VYYGDIALEATIDLKFTTRSFSTGAPTTLSGTPVVSAYVDNGTTEITAGITLTADFDGRTGLNNVRVVATAANGYTAGTNVQLVITTGTVGGVSVVGEVVGSFSIQARSGLRPTTAGRTLDVTATGAAGVDWGNVENQSTAVNLSATTTNLVNTATTVTNQLSGAAVATAVWQDATAGDFTVASSIGKSLYTGNVVPGAAGGHFVAGTNAATTVTTSFTTTFTGNLTGSVGSVTGNVGGNVVGSVGSISGVTFPTNFGSRDINATGGVGIDWGNVQNPATVVNLSGTNIDADQVVASVTGAVGSVTGAVGSVTGDIGGLAAGAITDVEDAVWDAVLANHLDSGSTGAALNAAGSAGDPWATTLPGAYGAGTAGHIIGTALPDIAPGTANGLLRGGTNTATTFAALTSTAAFTVGSLVNNGVTDVAQTGDSFARIGATGSGLTSLAPAATALSTVQWTNTLATNLGTTNATVAANLDAAVTSRLAPTTAGRTLDVTVTGAAGIDWGNVENQTTGVALTNTATGLVVNVTSVNGINSNVITAASLAADAVAEIQSGLAPASTALSNAVWTDALATNLGTTNATVASNLNATVSSRQATFTAATGVTFPANFSSALTLPTDAQLVKVLAAVYDTATGSGGNVLTLSNGATQTINLSTGTRTTVG